MPLVTTGLHPSGIDAKLLVGLTIDQQPDLATLIRPVSGHGTGPSYPNKL